MENIQYIIGIFCSPLAQRLCYNNLNIFSNYVVQQIKKYKALENLVKSNLCKLIIKLNFQPKCQSTLSKLFTMFVCTTLCDVQIHSAPCFIHWLTINIQ
jgi:hypothetical protein